MSSDLSFVWLLPAWNRPVIFCLQGKDGVFPYEFNIQWRFWRRGGISNFAVLRCWDDETSPYIPAQDQLRP